MSNLAWLQPPTEMVADNSAAWAWTIAAIIATAISLVLFPALAVRERRMLWIYLIIGGSLCFFLESPGDWLGATWYPYNSPWVFVDVLNRPMPFYLLLTYASYFPLGFWMCYRVLKQGPSFRSIVMLWVGGAIVNCMVEITFTQLGAHNYYGNNPVRIFGLPLYSIIQNGAFPIFGGILLVHAHMYWRGRHELWLIPAIPVGFISFAVCATWPMYLGLNLDLPTPLMWVAAIAAVTLNLVLCLAIFRSAWLRRLQETAQAKLHGEARHRADAQQLDKIPTRVASE
ncbi:hypothetical protein [Nocardia nepalensis]|uniref:hypothetical protein n=1 Tax=Nocardia nepalensis TaxID=3375448 RepID=UPI003B680263